LSTRPVREETEERAGEGHVPAPEGLISDVSPLVLLQVNIRSICNKVLEFWNLIGTYNPDVVIVRRHVLVRKLIMQKFVGMTK